MIHGWAVKWRSGPNNVDRKVIEHFIWPHFGNGGARVPGTPRHPVFFTSRQAARAWTKEHYGDIARRADLRAYPHDWKPPIVVRATLVVQEIVSVRNTSQRSRQRSLGKRHRK